MDYSEVLDNVAHTTKIMRIAFSQTQDIIKTINQSMSSAYNAISSTFKLINETVLKMVEQITPTVSIIRNVMTQLDIQSLLSHIRDINSLPQCLSEANSVIGDYDNGTVFETNTISIDEAVCENIIADGLIVSKRVVQDDKLRPIQRKSILKKFFKLLKSIFTSTILPLLLFIMAPFWQSVYDERIAPAIYYNEFLDLQEQHPDLKLRLVVKNTALYLGRHMKVVTAYVEKYDVVEVLEDRGKILKVRIFDSDEIGWIYKKYTNGCKKYS